MSDRYRRHICGKWGGFRFALAILFLFSGLAHAQKPNILFIAVDDLNCDIGAYGNRAVKSPGIDRIAAEGVLFANNHCQQPVCGASRASVLSGFTPEHTGITSFHIYMRDLYPDLVTLPQFFKNAGYHTVGMGKIFDPRNVSETDQVDLVSWTDWVDVSGGRWVTSTGKPVTEMADRPDGDYTDGKIADEGVKQIERLAPGDDPFFLAVGFKKPHLPFVAPKQYWDLYDRDSLPLAPYRKYADNDLEFVHNPGNEFYNGYDNVPPLGSWSHSLQREYIHGYYACVSFIDAQVGKLIDALKNAGVYDETIIVLWGDHGFSLGDHTNWGKHTLFEYATRSPLIVRVPGMTNGSVCQSPTEFLDIYPSLVDLAGFAVPDTLDGTSLLPVLSGEQDRVKSFSVSQFRRGGNQGFVLRSDYHQYVEWINNGQIVHRQLFDLAADPYQTVNLAGEAEYAAVADSFSFHLNRYLDRGINDRPLDFVEKPDSLALYEKQTNLAFSVTAGENDTLPLPGAVIRIGPLETPTGNTGYTSLNLPPSEYGYTVEKEDYGPVSGTIDLSGRDTLVRVTLTRSVFYLTLALTDTVSGAPIGGFTVSLSGQEAVTDSEGEAIFRLEAGTYALEIPSGKYHGLQRQIELQSDTLVRIALSPATGYVKFSIFEGDVPVKDAVVTLNGDEQLSNAIGMASFLERSVGSEYTYTVRKTGYREMEDSFVLRTDTTLSLQMVRMTAAKDPWKASRILYPNPARSLVHFTDLDEAGVLHVVDSSGRERLKSEISGSGTIDLSGLEEGIYLVRLSLPGGSGFTRKLLIER